jgi:hypothetical protein
MPKRKGAFPKVLEQTLSDRSKYLNLLKEEKEKPDCDSHFTRTDK